MLEKYFIKPETSDRIRDSWLGEPIENYVCWLSENGYAARNIHRRVPMLMHFAEFARNSGASTWEELPGLVNAFVEHWIATRRRHGRSNKAKRHVASAARVPVVQMLRLLLPNYSGPGRIPTPLPFIHSAPGFFDYLRKERGLSQSSIQHYAINLSRFEIYLNKIGLQELSSLSPAVLSAFTVESGSQFGKNTISVLCSHVRCFLSYLYRQGLLDRDLSANVDAPRIYRLSGVPRSISWGEVQHLLETVDRRSPVGKRDFAIMLLLVSYGLRAREVAALTLDSIDWQRQRLQVPDRKAGHNTAFPLSSVVGDAIIDYLKFARPESSHRTLFLQVPAPFRPVTHSVISESIGRRLRKAGINVPRPGSHTLRHTCVQRLIDRQFPLDVIGDYIGHSSPSSTEIYTKVNLNTLRDVAVAGREELV